jgi:dTDP-4-amino-4,6-dideoxygalactose transaminase
MDVKENRKFPFLMPLPPARVNLNLWQTLRIAVQNEVPLEEKLKQLLNTEMLFVADAWVNVLAQSLKVLADTVQADEVILPAYSCNEFSKAILLAGLKPVYVPLDANCRLNPDAISSQIGNNTLALLAVNNTGVVSNLNQLRNFCDDHNIYMVEDAGYTFLGYSDEGQAFGSFGHIAVINMSEGKTIPCGGAIISVNDRQLYNSFYSLKKQVEATKPKSNLKEFISLFIFKLGASRLGFGLYALISSLKLFDLKSLFSSEPSRKSEHYASGDLEWVNGMISLNSEHKAALAQIKIRPWNKMRKACAIHLIKQRDALRSRRKLRLNWWMENLDAEIISFSLPDKAMPVKLPFLLPQSVINDQIAEKLAWWGIKKQYPHTWPMYNISEKSDRSFYEGMYTLPLHELVGRRRIIRMAHQLNSFVKKQPNKKQ